MLGLRHLQRPRRHPRRRAPERHPEQLHPGVPAEVRLAARERRGPRHSPAPEEGHRDQRLRRGLHAVLHGRRACRQQRGDLHRPDRRRAPAHLAARRLQQHARRARLPAHALPHHRQAAGLGLQRRRRGHLRRLLPGSPHAAAGERLHAQRLGPGLPGAERHLQVAPTARPDQGAVEPGLALRDAARDLQPERLRHDQRHGGARVPERPLRVHGLFERLQLLALLVRALLPGHHPGGRAGQLAGRIRPT